MNAPKMRDGSSGRTIMAERRSVNAIGGDAKDRKGASVVKKVEEDP